MDIWQIIFYWDAEETTHSTYIVEAKNLNDAIRLAYGFYGDGRRYRLVKTQKI